jgi:hypothetical protein
MRASRSGGEVVNASDSDYFECAEALARYTRVVELCPQDLKSVGA